MIELTPTVRNMSLEELQAHLYNLDPQFTNHLFHLIKTESSDPAYKEGYDAGFAACLAETL